MNELEELQDAYLQIQVELSVIKEQLENLKGYNDRIYSHYIRYRLENKRLKRIIYDLVNEARRIEGMPLNIKIQEYEGVLDDVKESLSNLMKKR